MQSRFDDVMRNRCYDVMQSTYGKSDHLKSWQAFLCLKDCKSFLQWNVLCSHPYFVSLFLDILISLHLFLFLLGQAWVSPTQHVVYSSNRPSFLPCIYSRTSLNSIYIGLNTYHMQQPSELYVIVQQPSGLHTVVQWVAADVCNQLLANMYITLLPVWYYMQWSLIYRYLCCSPRAKARGEGLGTGIP